MKPSKCGVSPVKYHQPSAAFVDIFHIGTWKCHWFIILLAFYLSLSHFNIVLNKCCRATKCPQVDNYRASIKKYCDWIAPTHSDLEMLFTECRVCRETEAAGEGDCCFPFLYFNGGIVYPQNLSLNTALEASNTVCFRQRKPIAWQILAVGLLDFLLYSQGWLFPCHDSF